MTLWFRIVRKVCGWFGYAVYKHVVLPPLPKTTGAEKIGNTIIISDDPQERKNIEIILNATEKNYENSSYNYDIGDMVVFWFETNPASKINMVEAPTGDWFTLKMTTPTKIFFSHDNYAIGLLCRLVEWDRKTRTGIAQDFLGKKHAVTYFHLQNYYGKETL